MMCALRLQNRKKSKTRKETPIKTDCLSPKLKELDGPGGRATNQDWSGGRSHYLRISGRNWNSGFLSKPSLSKRNKECFNKLNVFPHENIDIH